MTKVPEIKQTIQQKQNKKVIMSFGIRIFCVEQLLLAPRPHASNVFCGDILWNWPIGMGISCVIATAGILACVKLLVYDIDTFFCI